MSAIAPIDASAQSRRAVALPDQAVRPSPATARCASPSACAIVSSSGTVRMRSSRTDRAAPSASRSAGRASAAPSVRDSRSALRAWSSVAGHASTVFAAGGSFSAARSTGQRMPVVSRSFAASRIAFDDCRAEAPARAAYACDRRLFARSGDVADAMTPGTDGDRATHSSTKPRRRRDDRHRARRPLA